MTLVIPKRLESERLVIRPFVNDDLERFHLFMTDEKATKYLLFTEEQKTKEAIKNLLEQTIENYEGPEQIYALAIADKSNNKFIGSLGLGPDFNDQNYQIYWSILPEFWNMGLATEATITFLEYVFSKLGINKVVAYSHPDNIASTRVAENVGMKNRGTLKVEGFEHETLYFTIEK